MSFLSNENAKLITDNYCENCNGNYRFKNDSTFLSLKFNGLKNVFISPNNFFQLITLFNMIFCIDLMSEKINTFASFDYFVLIIIRKLSSLIRYNNK